MTESKIELTERLRREGRWPEASKFKDEAIRDFKSKGMKKAEAADQAWAAMAAAFPPLPVAKGPAESAAKASEIKPSGFPAASANGRGRNGHGAGVPPVPEEDIDIDALLERVGDRQPPDLIRDTLWTYENLPNRKAKPENAPSLGAWSLLQWARQYRNRFFEQILPKAMGANISEDEQNQRAERKSIAEMREVLERMKQQSDEELAAEFATKLTGVPEGVRQRVRAVLTDWSRRFDLVLPDGAATSLEAHVAELVNHCVKVLGPESGGC